MSSEIKVDTISEQTSGNGVAIDGLTIKDGGITATTGATVFNEGSADIDFRVESNNESSMLHVNAGTDTVLIGTDTTDDGWFDADGTFVPGFMTFGNGNTDGRLSAFVNNQNDAGGPIVCLGKTRATAPETYTIVQADDQIGIISFQGGDGTTFVEGASIRADIDSTPGSNDMPGRLEFFTTSDGTNSGSERMRIDRFGDVFIGKTTNDGDTVGHFISALGAINHVRSSANVLTLARNGNDGAIAAFRQGGSEEGFISVSGSTISYNSFTGSHWSRLADNSKPTILRGTIMDSIDEMCDWYQAVADVEDVKYTAEDQDVIDGVKNVGDVKIPGYKIKKGIALPDDKSVGDSITFKHETDHKEVEYTGIIVKENDVKHTKSKVSDTEDSKKVYGVFHRWDDGDDGLDGDVNDMEIAQVGTYIIRVNKDVTVEAGDLLVSNGDGTAKLQDDDIIRSKTVAKVNSNIKVETYEDGSYTVPCTLHC
tara:strand:- start:58 stop:1503 length:1446 start_codon:yes stop_codon:yes gene_type:complete